MINLIPNEEKKKMTKYFYYRLAVLFLAMLCVSLFIAILALLPAYFFSNSKNNIASKKLEIQKTQYVPLFGQETETVIKDINNKLNLIESAEKNKFLVSEKVINAIFMKKISSIKITQISYENNSTTGRKISIRGTAPSRETLLSFRKALEDGSSFKSVDLPISNFVKGSDIQFYLSLIPA
jgi:hypothetical protein